MSEQKTVNKGNETRQEKKKRLQIIADWFKKNSTLTVSDLKNLLKSESESSDKSASTDYADKGTQDNRPIPYDVRYYDALVCLTNDALPDDELLRNYISFKGIDTPTGTLQSAYGLVDTTNGKRGPYENTQRTWKTYVNGDIQLSTKLTTVLQHIIDFVNQRPNSEGDFKKFLADIQSGRSAKSIMGGGSKMGKGRAMDIISEAIETSAKKCVVFTGAPGTGKTYCVEEYVKDITKQDGKDGAPHPNWEFVQFHSSYDYTDFVEGLRPVKNEKDDMVFRRMDGIFKAFCRRAARKEKEEKEKKEEEKEKKEKFYFIIDEINRADLGRVFGELMYCFEKRGEKHRIAMQYDNLPAYGKDGKPIEDTYGYDCFKDGFYIPDNVIIIGTMNDIDRSVETFDFALRRRFDWVEIEADAVMKSSLVAMMEKKLKDEKKADRLTADEEKFVYDLVSEILPKIMAKKDDKGAIIGGLNGIIETQSGLGKEFKIGPAYFKDYEGENLEDDNPEGKDLKGIWKYNVAPILREYMRGRQDPEEFIKKCYAELFPKDETEKTSPPGSGDTESAQQGEQE